MNYIDEKESRQARKARRHKRAKIKKIVFLGSITLFLTITSYVCLSTFHRSNNKAIDERPIIIDEKSMVAKEPIISDTVLNSNDPVIEKLVELSSDSPKIKEILSNVDLYPKELLELASKKSEPLDFVYNYPTAKDEFTNKEISIDSDYTQGEFPLLIQWDKRWGYDKYGDNFIAVNGCAPTTLAMAIAGLTGNTDITPKDVADFAYNNNYYVDNIGSSWTLISEGSEHFGLKSEELPLSESVILSTLRSGHPIIVTLGPGEFTNSGHFLLLTGVTDDDKIIINDPDSKIRSEKTWDIDVFMNETRNLWKISV